jgi:hypothetical protein
MTPTAPFDGDLLHLAVPVTRQVQISGPQHWKHLVCGIDSLDLGLEVWWENAWAALAEALERGKISAGKTEGVIWEYRGAGECLILPRGKPPMYAYHLQTADFHLFISERSEPSGYPNVYVSLLAKSLWQRGPTRAIEEVLTFVRNLGGRVGDCVPSRVDLCADFQIPGGVSLNFLLSHVVARTRKTDQHLKNGVLETFYVGARGAPVLSRIYDKGAEIMAHGGEKLWFLDIWKLPAVYDIWRVEFQLRRVPLKQLRIHSFDELVRSGGSIWRYLTEQWMSLRLPDDENTSRRTLHPWWLAVQAVGEDFGNQLKVKRKYSTGGQAPVEWYTSHASGCLAGFAAREGVDDFDTALGLLTNAMRTHWSHRNFEDRYRVERIKLGFNDQQEKGETNEIE